MRLCTGTSGYSYKEWKGPFYPEKLAAKDMLRFYGEKLPAVEINNTFYRLPKESVLQTWNEQVPEDFRFAIKASRRITHFKRLKEADDETEYLLKTTQTLGDRLGVILFQLPPNLRADLERLQKFMKILPDDLPAAFEFRHESWLDEPILDALRERNFPMVIVDSEDEPAEDLRATADWGYLRLRRPGYERADLANWAQRIASEDWNRAFVFFKHEDEGAGPKMAAEFMEVAGRVAQRKPARATTRATEERRETG